jgi:hypothetical protein
MITLTAIGLTPGASNTVHICIQTVQYIFTYKQYSTYLHTNSTVHICTQTVQYIFTHKQYSTYLHTNSTVHIYTQTVQYIFAHKQDSTYLHTNRTVHIYTKTVQYTIHTNSTQNNTVKLNIQNNIFITIKIHN